jgi:hypothetical protein
MTDKKAGADTHHFKMKPQPGSPPGLETDGKGNIIPFAQRTEDDQAKAKAAARGKDGASVKDPEQELEHPAAMPRSQQGQGGKKRDNDPSGQQGGTH